MRPLPRLFAVTTDAICRAPDYLARARAIGTSGLHAAIVVRAPASTAAEQAGFATETVAKVGRSDSRTVGPDRGTAQVIVHARPDLARAVAADGVQLRRQDLSPADARAVLGPGWIGVSVPDRAEAEAAIEEGADYLVAGNVFESPSHPGRPGKGTGWLQEICSLGRPVVAIGGITPDRAIQVREAGSWGVAAISALWDDPEPERAARALLAPWADPADRGGELQLTVNGEAKRVRNAATMAELLARLELDPRAVVVELNRRIVRRPELADTPLRDGDAVELVHFVGGG